MVRRLAPALVALGLMVGACSGGLTLESAPSDSGFSSVPSPGAAPPPGSCHARGTAAQPLPDPACTPGMADPAVTQDSIASTICRSGWSSERRRELLPESASQALKRAVMAAYGFPEADLSAYEGDHLISIELGGVAGGPGVEKNFWPERNDHPRSGVINTKDEVENAAHSQVCVGRMTLAEAQKRIAANWVDLGRSLGVVG